MPKNFYEVSWIFFIYSFIGWICEVVYMTLGEGRFINRGMLFGPICPIYGFGMLAIIFTVYPLKLNRNVFLLFFSVMFFTTLIELFGGFILKQIFHERWWDYSDIPFNFKGYICLKFSLLWGIGGTLVIGAIHPLIYSAVEKVPTFIGLPLLIIVFAVFASDLVIKVTSLIKLSKEMQAMVEIEKTLQLLSDKIGFAISGATYVAASKGNELVEEHRPKLAKLKEEYAKKLAEFRKIALRKEFAKNRIFKAFPDLKNGRFKLIFDRIQTLKNKDETNETDEL